MKGYRFYAEMPEDRKSKSASKAFPVPHTVDGVRRRTAAGGFTNCVAVVLHSNNSMQFNFDGTAEAYVSLFDHEDSDVCFASVSLEYLRERCTRVPAELALKCHPKLAARLSDD